MSKNNICVIGLAKQFVDSICIELAEKLEMFYANADKIIDFELLDIRRMEEVCGNQYVEKEENAIIGRLCSYENTLINLDYTNFNNALTLEVVKEKCLLIYLKLSRSRFKKEIECENMSRSANLISIDLFNDRDIICSNVADLIIDCDNLSGNELTNLVIEKIYRYYE